MFNNHKFQEVDYRPRQSRLSGHTADDRRQLRRMDTELTGYITSPQNNQIVHCDILDFSAKGAKIRPTDVSQVPKFFELRMPGQSYLCEVIRRKGQQLGVQFLQHA
jgi:hypothetical protein